MRALLLLVVCCLALNKGRGAPRTAVYKFVRCNPEGDESNCVIQQTPEMAWSPDLPAKLPASAAQYLEAEPVENESPPWGEEEDEEVVTDEEMGEEEDAPTISEEGESPVTSLSEDGSGAFEGSAGEGSFMADKAMPADTGSGESWTEKEVLYKVGDLSGMRKLFPSRLLDTKEKFGEQELKEDHLLQL